MEQRQPSIFRPTLHVTTDIKMAMREAIERSGLSRAEIVERMNYTAPRHGVNLVSGNGTNLSQDTLDKWLNPEVTSRKITLEALLIFCAVLNDHTPIDVYVRPLECRVLGGRELATYQWGKAKLAERTARRQAKKLEEMI